MRTLKISLVVLSFLVMITPLLAEEGTGGYAGAFLRMGLGARPKALGGAFTAVAEGSYAGYYNPGALPRNNYKELSFSYRTLALDRKFSYIGLVIPLTPKAASGERPFNAGLHVGWINAGVDNIDGRTSSGEHYDTFSNSENAFSFGFAVQPIKFISVGFCAKVLYNRFPKLTRDDAALTAKGFGFDFGLMLNPITPLTGGTQIKDIRSKNTWNTESVFERGTTTYDEFPNILRLGIAYRLLNDRLLLAADFQDNKKQDAKIHFGTEFIPYKNISLRVGLDDIEPTFGFGYLFKIWKLDTILDYAYVSDEIAPSGEHNF